MVYKNKQLLCLMKNDTPDFYCIQYFHYIQPTALHIFLGSILQSINYLYGPYPNLCPSYDRLAINNKSASVKKKFLSNESNLKKLSLLARTFHCLCNFCLAVVFKLVKFRAQQSISSFLSTLSA